jgi:hypothetical protein
MLKQLIAVLPVIPFLAPRHCLNPQGDMTGEVTGSDGTSTDCWEAVATASQLIFLIPAGLELCKWINPQA